MDGTADDMKGRVKEAVGDLTDDDDMKAEGKADRTAGKAKDVVSDLASKAEDVIDRARDRARRD